MLPSCLTAILFGTETGGPNSTNLSKAVRESEFSQVQIKKYRKQSPWDSGNVPVLARDTPLDGRGGRRGALSPGAAVFLTGES